MTAREKMSRTQQRDLLTEDEWLAQEQEAAYEPPPAPRGPDVTYGYEAGWSPNV